MHCKSLILSGATGFVGSAIARALLRTDLSFAVLLRGETPSYLAEAVRGGQVECVSPIDVGASGPNWRTVVHAAGWVPKGRDSADPLDAAIETNLVQSLRFLGSTLAADGHLALLSTGDVYGTQQPQMPIDESAAVRPETFYAASKIGLEQFSAVLCDRRGAKLTVLRLGQVYGPGDSSRKVVPSFARQVRSGQSPVIHGDGLQQRNWIYVDDVAAVIMSALQRPVPGTYNIAGAEVHTVLEVAREFCELAGHGLTPRTSGKAGQAHLVFSTERAARELGFVAATHLNAGIREYWRWLSSSDWDVLHDHEG